MPHRCEVERLEHHALVGRAVSEKGGRDLLFTALFKGESGAAGKRSRRADDPVCPEQALLFIREVHGASVALAKAGRLPEDLRHH